VTRDGCCRGEDSEGCCARGEGGSRKRSAPHPTSWSSWKREGRAPGRVWGHTPVGFGRRVKGFGGAQRRSASVGRRGAGPVGVRQRTATGHIVTQGSTGRTRAGQAGQVSAVLPETWRTSWSAAGCNKPAAASLEQAVEVGRNDKGGRCERDGSLSPKVDVSRDFTGTGQARGMSMEGNLWTTPREEFRTVQRVRRAAARAVGARCDGVDGTGRLQPNLRSGGEVHGCRAAGR